MKAWLRQHWLAIVLAFLAPPLIWYLLERKETALRVVLAADIPVVAVQRGLSHGITVLHGSDTVSSVRAIEISVTNTGNQPIRRADYESALTIGLPSRIIAPPTVTIRQPPTLEPSLTTKENQVVVEPLLLNGGDTFTFRTLLADWTESKIPIELGGRVSDVREIEFSDQSRIPNEGKEEGGGGWFVGLYLALIIVVTLLGQLVTRLRIPARLQKVAQTRQALDLAPSQRERADTLLAELTRASPDARSRMREIQNRLELHVRGIAARAAGSPLSRKSVRMLLPILANQGVLSPNTKLALDSFFHISDNLLSVVPRWRREEDYALVGAFGAELLAALSDTPSVLESQVLGHSSRETSPILPQEAERTARGPAITPNASADKAQI